MSVNGTDVRKTIVDSLYRGRFPSLLFAVAASYATSLRAETVTNRPFSQLLRKGTKSAF